MTGAAKVATASSTLGCRDNFTQDSASKGVMEKSAVECK